MSLFNSANDDVAGGLGASRVSFPVWSDTKNTNVNLLGTTVLRKILRYVRKLQTIGVVAELSP